MKQRLNLLIMNTLKITFESAQNDIKDCWENPIRPDARITRDWIYAVDPETMEFVKTVFSAMSGEHSLYSTFVAIMKSNSLQQLFKTA